MSTAPSFASRLRPPGGEVDEPQARIGGMARAGWFAAYHFGDNALSGYLAPSRQLGVTRME
jgi:hypothetical protein